MMKAMTIKNKRLKMSPGGLITLPVSARRCLGMTKGIGMRVGVTVSNKVIVIKANPAKSAPTLRVSPGGVIETQDNARTLLAAAVKRHYWLELFDGKKTAIIHPFAK
jgi:hypothetical protein